MRPDTESFLDRVRHAEDPTRADEERVRRALLAAVAAGLASSVALETAGASSTVSSTWGKTSSPSVGKLGVFGSKLNAALVFGAVALGSGDVSHRPASVSEGVLAPRALERTSDARGSSEPAAGAPRETPELPMQPDAPPGASVRRVKANDKTAMTKTAAKTTADPGAPNLRAEIELLQRVQAALKRADGLTALGELDAHQTGDRTLLAEREAARILALCELHRVEEARVAAREFGRRHPDSVQGEAIATSCANSRRIGEP